MSRRHAQRAKQNAKREQAKHEKRRRAAEARERRAVDLRRIAIERAARLGIYDEFELRMGAS